MDLPIRAFCLSGDNAKIELIITEIFGFPNTSIEGGYDVKGILNIDIGCYFVRYDRFIFATGVIYRLLEGLEKCYRDLKGKAEYRHLYERDLEFTLEMINLGHAVIQGTFRENPAVSNKLDFEMSTDQTFIKSAINDIKNVIKVFSGYTGLKGQ